MTSSTGRKSRDKGKSAERALCKLLSAHLGGSFIRSAGSGAYVGGRNACRKQVLGTGQVRALQGDVVPPDGLNMVVEVKSYAVFGFHQLLRPGGSPLLDGWIKQCLDVVDVGDFWLLAFQVSRRGWFVAVPEPEAARFAWGNCAHYTGRHGAARIGELESFLAANAEAIRRRCA